MSFTDVEKRRWHSERARLREDTGPLSSHTCDHCGHAIPLGGGNGSEDFRVCDACDSD